MKTELILKFEFEASHSLSGYEAPHPHIWLLETSISGHPVEGKIIDMILLRQRLQNLVNPLALTYLNENITVDSSVQKFPTCESLCSYFKNQIQDLIKTEFLKENNTLKVEFVSVALCDMNHFETGRVKLAH